MTDNSKKKDLFLQTLTNAYNHQEYVRFLQELLNDVQMVAPTRFNKEFSSLSGVIAGHYHIGNYKGADGKKMALFAVQLQNSGNVENARSSQRAFIKTLLDNSGCDGALAAFFTTEKDANGQERPSDKWRLSLIRMGETEHETYPCQALLLSCRQRRALPHGAGTSLWHVCTG